MQPHSAAAQPPGLGLNHSFSPASQPGRLLRSCARTLSAKSTDEKPAAHMLRERSLRGRGEDADKGGLLLKGRLRGSVTLQLKCEHPVNKVGRRVARAQALIREQPLSQVLHSWAGPPIGTGLSRTHPGPGPDRRTSPCQQGAQTIAHHTVPTCAQRSSPPRTPPPAPGGRVTAAAG